MPHETYTGQQYRHAIRNLGVVAMVDWRTVLLGVAAFGATFAGGMWFGVGNLPTLFGLSAGDVRLPRAVAETLAIVVPPKPIPAPAKSAAAIHPQPMTAEVPAPRAAAPAPAAGKGLTDDDRLRQAVILRAKAYLKPSCNADSKTLYVMAATKYAEVLMRSAGCSQFPACRISQGFLDGVWQGNRSALDQPVAAAMASVHAAGGLTEKSFRGDVGRAVRVIAGRDFARGAGPECQTSQQQTRRRVRWRR